MERAVQVSAPIILWKSLHCLPVFGQSKGFVEAPIQN